MKIDEKKLKNIVGYNKNPWIIIFVACDIIYILAAMAIQSPIFYVLMILSLIITTSLFQAKKMSPLVLENYELYLQVVNDENLRNTNDIAKRVGQDAKEVNKIITYMINSKCLLGVKLEKIDQNNSILQLEGEPSIPIHNNVEVEQEIHSSQLRIHTLKCPSCGAPYDKDKDGKCEYCGTKIYIAIK